VAAQTPDDRDRVQLELMAALVALAFVALRRLEHDPLPGWDGARARASGAMREAAATPGPRRPPGRWSARGRWPPSRCCAEPARMSDAGV